MANQVSIAGYNVSTDHLIAGNRVGGAGELELRSPQDNTVIGTVANANADLVNRAIGAARDAFPAWAALGPEGRLPILTRFAELIEQHNDALAIIESTDNGMQLARVKNHMVSRAAHNFSFFAEWALKLTEKEAEGGRNHDMVRYEPAGVCALITPWNAPMMLTTWKLGPCLAAGNTMVVKPPELAPLSVNYIAELAKEAGVPDGVINIVNGTGVDAGMPLVSSPDIARISFTGSVPTARVIARAAAENLTQCSFELGGKSPMLVFASADLDAAAATIAEQYFNAGQVCLSATRIFVEESVADELLAMVKTRVAQLKVGDSRQEGISVGPIISQAQFDKVKGFVDRAKDSGAELVYGGNKHPAGDLYFEPTMFTNVTHDSELFRSEVFGPVSVWEKFSDEAQAIEYANDQDYGLGSVVFTGDREQAIRVGDAVIAGTCWVNSFYVRNLAAPFGGAGNSGVGREGGDYSFEFFCEIKNLSVNEASFAEQAPAIRGVK